MNRARISPWMLFGLLIILSIVAGCQFGPSLSPVATITPTPFPTCGPTPTPIIFYSSAEGVLGSQNQLASDIAGDIYVKSLAARRANDTTALSREKSRALQFLAYETMRWSQHVDIPEKKVRLIVTFISPELIHAVILNHILYKDIKLTGDNLSDYTYKRLQGMDQRQEFLFLVTVQAELPTNGEIQIELPARNFFLKKNSDFRIPVSHTDGFFKQSIKLSSDQHAGFIYFPFGVSEQKDTCQSTLDTSHDKYVMLVAEGAVIDKQEPQDIVWQVPFVPPLDVGSAIPTPNPDLLLQINYAPSALVPPIQNVGPKGMVTALTDENREYWSKLGQFVWANLTLDYFPAP